MMLVRFVTRCQSLRPAYPNLTKVANLSSVAPDPSPKASVATFSLSSYFSPLEVCVMTELVLGMHACRSKETCHYVHSVHSTKVKRAVDHKPYTNYITKLTAYHGVKL